MELVKGDSSSIQFERRKREPANISGEWRLATVEEVRNNLQVIKQKSILPPRIKARLLDGWAGGQDHGYEISSEYKPNMRSMIVVKTKVSRGSDNSFCEEMYSGIYSTPEGRKAALLLSCDDKIAEVLLWVLRNVENQTELDELNKSIDKTFGNGRTILHYAAEAVKEEHGLGAAKLLMDQSRFDDGKVTVQRRDKYLMTALHIAAFHGYIKLCEFLIKEGELKIDGRDLNWENPFHSAVSGNKIDKVDHLFDLCSSLEEEKVEGLVWSQDRKGKTALHKAAANGNTEMMEALLARIKSDKREDYIRKSDRVGETALHEAIRGGHTEAVKFLLQHGSSPLIERNDDDKTALHYAVKVKDVERAKEVAKLLLDHLQSDDEKTLFLWASAAGVGTAEESAKEEVREFLQKIKRDAAGSSNNLLRTAIKQGLENTAWELITRGGDIQQIKDEAWKMSLNVDQQQHLRNVLQHVDAAPNLGRDQPTGDDSLGRIHFAEGLASLFLNPFVETPVTVGISGHWGMGKSSLMVQTEIALLKAAAQLAFPNLLQIEKFPGCKEWNLSKSGRRKYEKIRKAAKHLLKQHKDPHKDPLVRLLENYQQQYHDVYRSLAAMDRSEMFYVLRKIPAILTVQYNAWHYQNELEAWAGLAVEITKVVEGTMNMAQTIRTCCRYAWNEQQGKVYFVLILPCLLMAFIAVWIAWAAWLLLSRSDHKELVRLKYGCIPVTVLAIAWSVLRQLFSVLKPISQQIMVYMRLPDHSGNLGYQQKVISDIKFLKDQIGERPSWLWKFIAGQWCWNWFGLYTDTVKGTPFPKLPPASTDDLRIIVFVDDLDRCEDAVILQVLSAINLVLAACEINVILGMDKTMVEKAIANKFEHSHENVNDKEDLANKYLSKIVQLPLALPDPNYDETKNFLHRQLGVVLERKPQSSDAETEKGRSQEDIDSGEAANITTMTDETPSAPDAAAHVAVNLGQNEQGRRTGFLSTFWLKVVGLLEPCRAFRKCLAQLQQSNGTNKTETPSKLLPGAALNSILLMPKYYSAGERAALSELQLHATDDRKLPREWKRFLSYHRLAWNILSESGCVKALPNWQVQLVVWIFCCWQWKDQMNIIIEKWLELLYDLHGNKRDRPSLCNIVECYGRKYGTVEDDVPPWQMEAVKLNWMRLNHLLIEYDVSMDCILAFQNFRLHCKVGHLREPFHG